MSKSSRKKQFQHFYDTSIDLHGYILEDAVLELEKTIYSGKHNSVLVIHGKGQGILKRGLRKYLYENNYVKEVHHGEDLNLPGSDGVTVIYLK